MTRIASGVTDQYIYFVAVDATDLKTRETGLATWTVYRSRNGGAATAMTTPTINETSSANMPGVYELLLDEDMTIDSGDETQEMVFHITHSGMAPVTRVIELYRPKITAGNTLDVTATGAAGIDWGNVENPTTTINFSATTIKTATDVETDTADIQTRLPAALVSGRMDSSVGAAQANTITASALATDAVDEIVDAVWDEVLTAGTHNVASSAGRRLRQVDSAFIVTTGTAQAGGATSITLEAGASSSDNIYKADRIQIVGGTGVGESSMCTAYNGTTKVATVYPAWTVTPDNTSIYELVPACAAVRLIEDDVITSSATAASFVTEIQSGLATQTSVDTIDDFLDTEIAAIKAKTDSLTFTTAGLVDANIQQINNVTITGDGSAGDKFDVV